MPRPWCERGRCGRVHTEYSRVEALRDTGSGIQTSDLVSALEMPFPPQAIALVFSASLAVAIAAAVWHRRATPGGASFTLLMIAVAAWSIMEALEKVAPTIGTKILCAKVEYLGITSVPALWLMFALGYSQQEVWLTRRNILLLWIMPVITLALAATNEWHRLIWSAITPASNDDGALLVYGHGPWFWLFVAYNYVLILLGTLALGRALLGFPRIYRRQAVIVLLGLAIPWIGNATYLAGWSPVPGLDLTPLAFTLSGVVCAWGMFRFQLFDLVPVARDAVIESMVDGVIVLDAYDRIADINPAAQHLLGVGDASPLGQAIGAVQTAWPDVVTRLATGTESQIEIRVGSEPATFLDVRIAPLHDQRGNPTGRLILLRDVTARKLVDELRDDLTYALVHDLRNPLAGISSSLEISAEEAASPVQREMLQIARANARRMLGLVESILDVSRLESGGLPLERRCVHLAALVAETVQLQQPLAKEKGLHLDNAVAADLPAVLVDPRLIVRVLHNLIDNAIKFAPHGGTIRISAAPNPAAAQVVVSVSDTGPGIASGVRNRLFHKFAVGREKGHGSGLGLAFCRLTVEAHGGRIWVDESKSAGATIAFTLPVSSEALAE
jgi:signal transduction histidine kinase